MKNKKGFTLIEIIIALAILAILGAVAVPIYRGYMSGSAKSEAKSNLQTLSMLLDTYYSDNAKYTPATGVTYAWRESPSTNDFSWLPSFQPRKATGGATANYDYTVTATATTTFTATASPVRGPVLGSGDLTIDQAGNKPNW